MFAWVLQVGLSPGLELSVRYQLNVLEIALTFSGAVLLRYNDLLIELISAAFDAPSKKVMILSLDLIHPEVMTRFVGDYFE